MKPAVILKSDFVVSSDKNYSNYVNYIDREGAKNRGKEVQDYNFEDASFENYLEYMNRSTAKYSNEKEKGEGLFTNDKDLLNKTERREIKKMFQESQQKGTVLWRDVYSFDNEWLKENGFMNDGLLDEKSIKDATRQSMSECFKRENLKDTGYWVGEIHYNTDNIHVHVASTETKNTRPMMEHTIRKKKAEDEYEELVVIQPRGKRKPSTEDSMKSSFINHLADRDNTLERLSTLRYELHHSMRIDEKSIKQKKRLEKIKSQLPEERRHWSYNHYNMKTLKQPINEYTHQYMNMYHKKEFDEYKNLLKKDSEMNKALYGIGDKNKNRYQDTYENKMNDLNSKMGNALLKSLKEKEKSSYQTTKSFEVSSEHPYTNTIQKSNNEKENKKVKFKVNANNRITKYDLYAIQRAFKNHRKDQELETQHNQLQRRIENENQNEL